jgi:hypothetical protein
LRLDRKDGGESIGRRLASVGAKIALDELSVQQAAW